MPWNAELIKIVMQKSSGVVDEDYVSYVTKWRDAGASLFGGCCRTTPNTIKGITKALSGNASVVDTLRVSWQIYINFSSLFLLVNKNINIWRTVHFLCFTVTCDAVIVHSFAHECQYFSFIKNSKMLFWSAYNVELW